MYCWSVFIQNQQCETVRGAAVVTVQNLLHGLVAHLSSGEPLQGHDGGVGPVAQQQLAGLDVTSQRGSMKSRLTERVHSVHLQPEELKSTHRSQITDHRAEWKCPNKNRPLLRVSAAPPGYHCEPSQQQHAGGS